MLEKIVYLCAVLPEDVPEDKQFILVSFDTDPLADNERMARLTEAQRRWVAGARSEEA